MDNDGYSAGLSRGLLWPNRQLATMRSDSALARQAALLTTEQVPIVRRWRRPHRRARARVEDVDHVNAGAAPIGLARIKLLAVAPHHEGVAHRADQVVAQRHDLVVLIAVIVEQFLRELGHVARDGEGAALHVAANFLHGG